MCRPVSWVIVLMSSRIPALSLAVSSAAAVLRRGVSVAVRGVDLALAVVRDVDPGVAGEGDHRRLAPVGRDVQHHHGVGVDAAAVVLRGERLELLCVRAGSAVVAQQQDVLVLAVRVLLPGCQRRHRLAVVHAGCEVLIRRPGQPAADDGQQRHACDGGPGADPPVVRDARRPLRSGRDVVGGHAPRLNGRRRRAR